MSNENERQQQWKEERKKVDKICYTERGTAQKVTLNS